MTPKKLLCIGILLSVLLSSIPNILADETTTNKNEIDCTYTTGPFPTKIQSGDLNDEVENCKRSTKVIPGVPSYIWQHGCGPTAAGMVIGYWDRMGFDNLVIGDASTQTEYVDDMIASKEHFEDYSKPLDDAYTIPDKSESGNPHEPNSIADYTRTSWSIDGSNYGWSLLSHEGQGMKEYAQSIYPDYTVETSTIYGDYYNTPSWNAFKNEINNGRPVILSVDSDGDGYVDHAITAIGYRTYGMFYACYTTWDNSIHWYRYSRLSAQNPFTVGAATFFNLYREGSQINYVDDDYSATSKPYNFFNDIQTAIYYSHDGDTIVVFPGIYDHITVDEQINIISNDVENTIIRGDRYHSAVCLTADGATISGFTIQEGGMGRVRSGMYVTSNDNTISNNIITNNPNGITLLEVSNNVISGNKIVNNLNGITLLESSSNKIYNNHFANNNINAYNQESTNTWHNTELQQGNYWSDFEDNDGYPNQYNIPIGDNIDLCPSGIQDLYATITEEYSTTVINKPIQFTSSVFNGVPPYQYHWAFDDGTISTEQNPNHFYTETGTHTATLTVTDIIDNLYTTTTTIHIQPHVSKILYIDDDFTFLTPGWQTDHFDNIQDGIDTSEWGDTIMVNSGVYTPIVIDKSLNIIGQDKHRTIIDDELNGECCVYIESNGVKLSGFTLKNSLINLYLITSNCIDISNNIIKDSPQFCVLTKHLRDSAFSENIFMNNTIVFYTSDMHNNDIYKNLFNDNYACIILRNADSNVIFHNKFINSLLHARDTDSDNQWYNTNLQEGNYWDDYTGTDDNGDGIGDTPYIISEENDQAQDLYPIMYNADVDDDNKVTPSDIGWVLNRIGATITPDTERADVNKDGTIDQLDTDYVISRLGKTF